MKIGMRVLCEGKYKGTIVKHDYEISMSKSILVRLDKTSNFNGWSSYCLQDSRQHKSKSNFWYYTPSQIRKLKRG